MFGTHHIASYLSLCVYSHLSSVCSCFPLLKVFAPNEVTGASQFWYLMHQMRKMKKTTGEILDIVEVGAGAAGCRVLRCVVLRTMVYSADGKASGFLRKPGTDVGG